MAGIDRLIRRAGGAGRVRTVIDVGANDGADSFPAAVAYPLVTVVAIEPTSELVESMRERGANLPNFVVVEAAVSEIEGDGMLHVFGGSHVLNSLSSMRPEGAAIFDRSATVVQERPVAVRRLDSICREKGITSVDVLHIDTQGSDLAVLRSLGDLARTVRAGVIETSFRVRLYEESTSERDAFNQLQRLGFRVFHVERLSFRHNLEHNLFFEPTARAGRRDLIAFRYHVAAAELSAWFLRWGYRPIQRLRAELAIRTHSS